MENQLTKDLLDFIRVLDVVSMEHMIEEIFDPKETTNDN